jgi:hypothetical protein
MKSFFSVNANLVRILASAGTRAVAAVALIIGVMATGIPLPANELPVYERPAFVHFEPGDIGPTEVREIRSTEVTDLVLVAAGYQHGYRPGMVCRVIRDGENVAEILLVEVRDRVSAGIIVGILSEKIIEPGDAVRVKTLQH